MVKTILDFVLIPWLLIFCFVGVFVFVFVFIASAEKDEVSKLTVVVVFLVSETTTFYKKLKVINISGMSIFCIFVDLRTESISFVEFKSSKEKWFCLLVIFFSARYEGTFQGSDYKFPLPNIYRANVGHHGWQMKKILTLLHLEIIKTIIILTTHNLWYIVDVKLLKMTRKLWIVDC